MNNRPVIVASILLTTALSIAACGGGGPGQPTEVPRTPTANVDAGMNKLIFRWLITPGATHYKLLENADGQSGFTQIGADLPATVLATTLNIPVHLHDFVNALYIVQGCNQIGCTGSNQLSPTTAMLDTIGYFKSSNTEGGDQFGESVALSADGTILAVGSIDDSGATGINGDQNDNSAEGSGAVHLFRFDGITWNQEAYIKASNAESEDGFGNVTLSGDGNTLAVSATAEDSGATGNNGDQSDNSAADSGAVYLFRFDGMTWFQEAHIKASNTEAGDLFGSSVALSSDGNTLVVGARSEDGNGTGINGDQNNNSASISGAAYLFRFDGQDWFQEAYIKASNTEGGDQFGESVALSADGTILAVGSIDDSRATGINGDQNDNSAEGSGAVYLFRFDGMSWFQEAYIKASNAEAGDGFRNVTLSGDGNTLAVSAIAEDSGATGIIGDQNDNSAADSGAVYVFRFDGMTWFQEAYIKASNTGFEDAFGGAVALGVDGNRLAVAASEEDSNATGVGGNDIDNSAGNSGAVYFFRFDGTDWYQHTYVKASNTESGDGLGAAVALSSDGGRMAVGAPGEDSNTTGISSVQSDNSTPAAGAVILY